MSVIGIPPTRMGIKSRRTLTYPSRTGCQPEKFAPPARPEVGPEPVGGQRAATPARACWRNSFCQNGERSPAGRAGKPFVCNRLRIGVGGEKEDARGEEKNLRLCRVVRFCEPAIQEGC